MKFFSANRKKEERSQHRARSGKRSLKKENGRRTRISSASLPRLAVIPFFAKRKGREDSEAIAGHIRPRKWAFNITFPVGDFNIRTDRGGLEQQRWQMACCYVEAKTSPDVRLVVSKLFKAEEKAHALLPYIRGGRHRKRNRRRERKLRRQRKKKRQSQNFRETRKRRVRHNSKSILTRKGVSRAAVRAQGGENCITPSTLAWRGSRGKTRNSATSSFPCYALASEKRGGKVIAPVDSMGKSVAHCNAG